MVKNGICFALSFIAFVNFSFGQVTPDITAWLQNVTGQTGYNGIEANVQKVQYSDNFVYVSCSGIPIYTIGPWAMNPNTPADQNWVFKINRKPTQNTGTPTAVGLGNVGVLTNGVPIFNACDAMSYNNQGIWHQNAVVFEAVSFDNCLGHPNDKGVYHHHQNPVCHNTTSSSVHSSIIGFSFDGFPIYGSYGYANTDGTGGIKRIASSYRKRSITNRQTLADGTVLTAAQYGPAIDASKAVGSYLEDFEFVQGLGDLDAHNGRFAVTPEYPNGIYAYYATIDESGASAYPYFIGPTYYGVISPGITGPNAGHATISETVTTYTPTTSVEEDALNQIKIYPNPASDRLFVELPETGLQTVKLTLYNLQGVEVNRQSATDSLTVLELNGLAEGVYFLKIEANGYTIGRKIIVE